MSQGPFKQSDEEFWTEPLKNLSRVSDEHAMKFQRALIIDGPREVDPGARKTLPVSLYYLAPQSDVFSFTFQDVAIVVASRREDRQVFCDMATDPITAPREHSTAKPDPDVFSGSSRVLDLKEHPNIPWQSGTWFVNVLVRDLVSNRIEIELADSASKRKDPESRKEEKPPAPAPASPEAGDPLPHYQAYAKSPALPDKPGIALSVERVIVAKHGSRAELAASFRLAPLRGELVPGASGDEPKAVIPITLVIIGTENAYPLPFTVRAPAYGNIGDTELTGHFALDLFDIPHFDPRAQTYFVYAFAGEVMAGPATLGLVSEEMLHRRH
jgi:hypothetical protein